MPGPVDVMNRFFPFPPYVPLTTIDSDFTFQWNVSKDLLAALMGCTSWFFPRW